MQGIQDGMNGKKDKVEEKYLGSFEWEKSRDKMIDRSSNISFFGNNLGRENGELKVHMGKKSTHSVSIVSFRRFP
jgi:hypothetical protein